MSELVSVLIPCFNREDILRETLESVVSQTWPSMEILAIDDGSSDGTHEVLLEFSRHSPVPMRVTSRANRGLAATRNEMMREAQGHYIAFVDSDDLWHPEKVRRQMDLLRGDDRIGLVHTDVEFIDPQSRSTGHGLDIRPHDTADWFSSQILDNNIQPSAVLIRRAVVDQVGLFDESLPACEDWDYWIRIARSFRIGHLPHRLTMMRQHAGRMSGNIELMRTCSFTVLNKVEQLLEAGDHERRSLLTCGRRRVHFKYGDLRLRRGDHNGARHDLMRAFGLEGRTTDIVYRLLQTLVPPALLSRVKRTIRPMPASTAP
jgi:glycosyltransferase involved in cell wall biosynthesis